MFEFKTLNFFETVECISHRDCEASGFGDTRNPTGCNPKQPAVGDPARTRRAGEDNLQNYLPAWMILWFLSQFSNKCKMHRKFQWTVQYPVRFLVSRTFYSIFCSHRQWKSWMQGTLPSKIQHSQLSCYCRGRAAENYNAIKRQMVGYFPRPES